VAIAESTSLTQSIADASPLAAVVGAVANSELIFGEGIVSESLNATSASCSLLSNSMSRFAFCPARRTTFLFRLPLGWGGLGVTVLARGCTELSVAGAGTPPPVAAADPADTRHASSKDHAE
jgi:hypothetical protein